MSKQASKRSAALSKLDETRVLLVLWDLAADKAPVKKGVLMERVKRKEQKSADYQVVFRQLEDEGAIALTGQRIQEISLTPQGISRLSQGLNSPDFIFENQIGAKTANALLRWLRQVQSQGVVPERNGKGTKGAIASYEEFKQAALDVYDRLNRDSKLDNLVPIYRIRREMGDQVERAHFDEWLLEMQADEIIQLQGGSLPDSDPSKLEDSVTTELSGLRCYATRLAA